MAICRACWIHPSLPLHSQRSREAVAFYMGLSLEGDEATLCQWVSQAISRTARGCPDLPASLIFGLATQLANEWGNLKMDGLGIKCRFFPSEWKICKVFQPVLLMGSEKERQRISIGWQDISMISSCCRSKVEIQGSLMVEVHRSRALCCKSGWTIIQMFSKSCFSKQLWNWLSLQWK